MDTSELLEQFVTESRECLEQIGHRLLEVEKAPSDPELLNDLFRLVHTLKGNCGLFDFKPLEQVVHAGEDLLDRVRRGDLAYHAALADSLLDAMDYTASLVDAIAATGALPADAADRARGFASALREHLGDAAPAAAAAPTASPPTAARNVGPCAAAPAATAAAVPAALPAWAQALPADWRRPGTVLLRYEPEAGCFFKGEDPWHLMRTLPGLRELRVEPAGPWTVDGGFDCYRCNLVFLAASDAPQAYLEEHVRYVPEQVAWHAVAAPTPVPEPVDPEVDRVVGARLAQLWDEQLALLSRPALSAGAVGAARRVAAALLGLHGDARADAAAELEALPGGGEALSGWLLRHHPEGASAAAVAAAAAGTAASRSAAPADSRRAHADEPAMPRVLKVSQDKIDRLMDLIGEMVVAKNALPYLADRAEAVFGQRELAREIKTQYSVINRIAEDMQHAIMQVRMLPVGTVFQRFGRLVRDLSRKLGKDVRLELVGEDTEADKNVIEGLADPLIHILRNSLDHGIELPAQRLAAGKPAQGVLRVAARQEGDRVMLDISDDGAGIDTDRVRAKAVERGLIPADRAGGLSEQEAVQLVFLPGFSTAESVSDLSGRGVGMDVVRSAVERINGSVTLLSERGRGTTIRLALPLSMAVTNVMMIESAGRRFGVPMDLIVETVRVPAEDIHSFKGAQTAVLRGRVVPLQALNQLLALEEPPRLNADGEHAVLVVRLDNETLGLLVDDFHGTSDIILKPLEGVLAGIIGFAGTALLGDGSVLMILNPKELF